MNECYEHRAHVHLHHLHVHFVHVRGFFIQGKSVVWDETENRLHAQKALLLYLAGASSI